MPRTDRSVQRATPADLTTLASDVGPAPMHVGALLRLDGPDALDAGELLADVADRIRSVPRLRQRLQPTPFGAGRPVWVDAAAFDIAEHVTLRRCPDPGDDRALQDLAAQVVVDPLPRDRPLWRMVIVDGLDEGGVAVVVVFHHVLSDGIGALTMLAALVDAGDTPVASPEAADWPNPPPSTSDLRREAARARVRAVSELPDRLRRTIAAASQLRPRGRHRPAPCSLLAPNGASRRIDLVDVELAPLKRFAADERASINDVVLAAVTAALAELLDRRVETVDSLLVSVPVSGRVGTDASDLGNQVGAVPVELPTRGDDPTRLRAIVGATTIAKHGWRGATDALIGPLFRALAAVGLLRRFVDGQHLVHTFVTNLRGPAEQLSLFGRHITDAHVVAVVPGNVTVSFAVFSYAGTLGVTVVSDPDRCADIDVLVDSLREHLARLSRR